MGQTTNTIAPAAATDEPAVPPSARRPARPLAHVSLRLAESLIDPALDSGRDVRPDRASRHDGWTPDRVRTFLDTLAETGVVADAARAAGMSTTSCYRLRNRTGARAFRLAWAAAEQQARRRVADEAMSRALNGCVEVTVKGDVVVERHRFDNRLLMTVLARLDRNAVARDDENRAARFVAEEFDQFLDLLCAGGEGASSFIEARFAAESQWDAAPEARMLERSDNYARYGAGLPEEIPVSDLDPEAQGSWTPEQQERADRAGLLDRLADEDEDDDDYDDDDGDEDEDEDDEIGARADVVSKAAAMLAAEAEAEADEESAEEPGQPQSDDPQSMEPEPGAPEPLANAGEPEPPRPEAARPLEGSESPEPAGAGPAAPERASPEPEPADPEAPPPPEPAPEPVREHIPYVSPDWP